LGCFPILYNPTMSAFTTTASLHAPAWRMAVGRKSCFAARRAVDAMDARSLHACMYARRQLAVAGADGQRAARAPRWMLLLGFHLHQSNTGWFPLEPYRHQLRDGAETRAEWVPQVLDLPPPVQTLAALLDI
jgi:hypothetical protein